MTDQILADSKPQPALSKSQQKLSAVELVDTEEKLVWLVNTLLPLSSSSGSIYVDVEGVKLSRHGTISLIQIWEPQSQQVFIVDVHTLGAAAFSTTNPTGDTFKSILESTDIKKYFFDVRNDSDALYSLFGIQLKTVVDVQLLELAFRTHPKRYVCGLAKCIERDCPMTKQAREKWQNTKNQGVKMFAPEHGGSYEVFNTRPLPQALVDYCVGDVKLLPVLARTYKSRISKNWMQKVETETERRLKESRGAGYQPHGEHKKFAPRGW